ncbi:helix-turn-helix domain-containing protein [Marinobacter halodurans]|uniref:Helix-turn-helix domain-containing protein n=1 Tax=Marinobacter halodurans TaxID=2528979 RepID=A0ABY1ZQH5_9GAMM|nr:RodZ domain-containing protein [Marinobacter halodurans]TBW59068.1 helix-turn-helix domain-containing protein [Marinobacter halodurans]
MINDDTQEQPEAAPLTGEVGHQLRRAREAKGITVADVADSQHLRPSVIQAIEDGQYDKIGSELFLKGYVRAYAEQVGLNATSLVETLDMELEPLRQEAEQARREDPLESIERKKRQKRRVARWVIWILLIAAVAVIASRVVEMELYSGIGGSDEGVPASAEQSGDSPAENPAPTFGGETEAGSADAVAPQAESGAEASEPAPIGQGDSALDGQQPTPDSAARDESTAPATPDEGSVSAPADNTMATVAPEADVSEPEPAPPVEDQPAAAAGDVLSATFTGDCWVSVKNAEGTTVVASLKRAGESLRYEGHGPFQVVLGAVDVVNLSYNGEPVDLSTYPASNNRVSLTLGN